MLASLALDRFALIRKITRLVALCLPLLAACSTEAPPLKMNPEHCTVAAGGPVSYRKPN